MRPSNLKTKIFLDGGIPKETKQTIDILGFLDGQTTNPSLVAKHPSFQACAEKGEKCGESDAWRYYREIVNEISLSVKNGSVSIEVYADRTTTAREMIEKGLELFSWVPNAHIKLPITSEGLKAVEALVRKGVRVNMTLCFSQAQATAVYAATRGASKGNIFVSPFVGRLDDRGENGMDLIKNILTMYRDGDGHVEVLTASIRSLDHLMYALALKSDIITAPFKILKEWGELGTPLPDEQYHYDSHNLKDIPYQELDLSKHWSEFDVSHELTDKGIDRFAEDWNAPIRK